MASVGCYSRSYSLQPILMKFHCQPWPATKVQQWNHSVKNFVIWMVDCIAGCYTKFLWLSNDSVAEMYVEWFPKCMTLCKWVNINEVFHASKAWTWMPSARVAFQDDCYVPHLILPSEIDPLIILCGLRRFPIWSLTGRGTHPLYSGHLVSLSWWILLSSFSMHRSPHHCWHCQID